MATNDARPDDYGAPVDPNTIDIPHQLVTAPLTVEVLHELDALDEAESERLARGMREGDPGARDAMRTLIRRRAEEADGSGYLHMAHAETWDRIGGPVATVTHQALADPDTGETFIDLGDSVLIQHRDGRRERRFPWGLQLITHPDRSVERIEPDGTRTITPPDCRTEPL